MYTWCPLSTTSLLAPYTALSQLHRCPISNKKESEPHKAVTSTFLMLNFLSSNLAMSSWNLSRWSPKICAPGLYNKITSHLSTPLNALTIFGSRKSRLILMVPFILLGEKSSYHILVNAAAGHHSQKSRVTGVDTIMTKLWLCNVTTVETIKAQRSISDTSGLWWDLEMNGECCCRRWELHRWNQTVRRVWYSSK